MATPSRLRRPLAALVLGANVLAGVSVAPAAAQAIAADQYLTGGPGLDTFGEGVAIDGDRLVVVSEDEAPARIYERQPFGDWTLVHEIAPPPNADDDHWGRSVDLCGDVLAIGALRAAPAGVVRGAVHLFERNADGTWSELQTLEPPGLGENEQFGAVVVIDGDRIFVGATIDLGTTVFERGSDGQWDLVASIPNGFHFLNRGISAHGDRVVIGGGTSAGVWERSGPDWNLVALLESSSTVGGFPVLGGDVAASDDGSIVFLGNTGGLGSQGLVDVFERSTDGYELVQSFTPDVDHLRFGVALEYEDGTLVVGTRPDQGFLALNAFAYVYEHFDVGGWLRTMEFEFASPGIRTLAERIAMSGDTVIVGLPAWSPVDLGRVASFEVGDLRHEALGVSVANGGEQVLHLRAPKAEAGNWFVMLGSASGTSPGTPVPGSGLVLPLVHDVYTAAIYTVGNGYTIFPWVGQLNWNGHAVSRFTLPPGLSPSFVGLRLHHAYFTLDQSTFEPSFASRAARVELVQ